MARYFIIALLVVFAICLMQVSAAPQEEKPAAASDFQDELKKAGEKITAAFNDAKPKLEELLAKGQEFFSDVGKKLSEEAGKIIPKNEENKS